MTALELLDLLESTPEGRWSDKEMDRLRGIATPGDVDQTLARQFVFGRLLLEATGVDFSDGSTSSALKRVSDEPQGRCRSHVRGSPRARMITGESPPVNEAERLERCHELATETSKIVDAVRQELPEAPLDFDDGDTSLPAQLARVGGLVDDIVDASALTPPLKNAGRFASHTNRDVGSLPRPRREREADPAHPTRSVPSADAQERGSGGSTGAPQSVPLMSRENPPAGGDLSFVCQDLRRYTTPSQRSRAASGKL